jgi:hypothetical protein
MPIDRTSSINPTTGRIEISATGSYGPDAGVSQEVLDDAITALQTGAPVTMNDFNELAAALGDDPAFAATMATALAAKQASDGDLTSIAALTTTSFGRNLLTLADTAALKAAADGRIAGSAADAATMTVNADLYNHYSHTAQAQALTIAAPTGTPVNGQRLIIRIKDNGTARALTWNAIFRVIGVTLPTTTVISKLHYIGCVYNSDTPKWDVVAVGAEA